VNPLPNDQLQLATELVEVWGARGGLLRRLGNAREALESYKAGSDVESRFVPNSTYNRVNAIKFALLSGLRTLTDIEGEIRTFEHLLTDALAKDQKLSDSGWAWADLADCRALIGDVAGAERAYRTFVQKAGSKAPDATLDVLHAILAKLREANDPRAAAVDASITALKQRLS
jgi:predicted RNA polymerase sigma factor